MKLRKVNGDGLEDASLDQGRSAITVVDGVCDLHQDIVRGASKVTSVCGQSSGQSVGWNRAIGGVWEIVASKIDWGLMTIVVRRDFDKVIDEDWVDTFLRRAGKGSGDGEGITRLQGRGRHLNGPESCSFGTALSSFKGARESSGGQGGESSESGEFHDLNDGCVEWRNYFASYSAEGTTGMKKVGLQTQLLYQSHSITFTDGGRVRWSCRPAHKDSTARIT